VSNASEEPGDHDQPVARQIEADVLEIVRAGAADADFFHGAQRRKGNVRIYANSPAGRSDICVLRRRAAMRGAAPAPLATDGGYFP